MSASRCVSLTPDQFRRLFECERDSVFRFLYRLTRNASDADDLLQETFLQVWRKRDQFDGRGSAEGWVKRTAFRTYLNQRTRLDRRSALAPQWSHDDATPADDTLERRDSVEFLVAKLREAVDQLPDGSREAFLLFRYEGMTCAQIADVTQAPVKTVETRVLRATKLLSEKLRAYRGSVPTW